MNSVDWYFSFRRNLLLPFVSCFCIILICSCSEREETTAQHGQLEQLIDQRINQRIDQLTHEVRDEYTNKLDCYSREIKQKAKLELESFSYRQIQAERAMYFLNIEQRLTTAKFLISGDNHNETLISKAISEYGNLDISNTQNNNTFEQLFPVDDSPSTTEKIPDSPTEYMALIDYLASHGIRQIDDLMIRTPSDGYVKDFQKQIKHAFRPINITAKQILKDLGSKGYVPENTLQTARSMYAAAMIASITNDSVVYTFPVLPFQKIPEVNQGELNDSIKAGNKYSEEKGFREVLWIGSGGKGGDHEKLIFRKKLDKNKDNIDLIFQYRIRTPLIKAVIPFDILNGLDKNDLGKDSESDDINKIYVFNNFKAKPFNPNSTKEKFYRSPELYFCICTMDEKERRVYRIRFQLTNSISESPSADVLEHDAIYKAEYILEESSGHPENKYLWRADDIMEPSDE